MNNRRDFIKSTLVVASGMAIGRSALAGASLSVPGLIYTAEDPGMWAKKVKSHAPRVSKKEGGIEIFTKHGMSEKHFIVRHTLVTADGKVLGSKTFYPSDEEARSFFLLPSGSGGRFYATSFCNKHDFWVTEFQV